MSTRVLALAVECGALLLKRGWTMSCAESCTGGLVAAAVTEVAGSSAWFDRGAVTYSNAAKHQMLGVAEATIERFGAVSEQTAGAMVSGILDRSSASVAVAITGIAGPTGGTPEKPVGTVCFGWQLSGADSITKTRQFVGDRASVRAQSVEFALSELNELLRR